MKKIRRYRAKIAVKLNILRAFWLRQSAMLPNAADADFNQKYRRNADGYTPQFHIMTK
ncbi:hypothetical protein [Neisseria dentiae]|uniref:hypothetical protein n=1 Tax=Neisseria dentiae TaxID=194197 RepID=UPI001301B50B|nr:hypothetical protein [Neisseria dentiae]QMT44172.1 hypothetical protein H3L92_06615 [Neisseria dentiae]